MFTPSNVPPALTLSPCSPYNPGPYSDLETLSWALLSLGSDWTPSSVSAQVVSDLSFSRLLASRSSLSIGAQARVGLTLLAGGKTGANMATVNSILLVSLGI